MANLREAYAATGLASLAWSEQSERAIDRVAAAGRCSALGIDLWRAKYQLESSAYARACQQLLKVAASRYPSDSNCERLVSQAMREYLSPACRACRGGRELIIDQKKTACPSCSGTGMHRYSDNERAREMQLSYAMTKHSTRKIGWLLDYLGTEDRRVNSIMSAELERT